MHRDVIMINPPMGRDLASRLWSVSIPVCKHRPSPIAKTAKRKVNFVGTDEAHAGTVWIGDTTESGRLIGKYMYVTGRAASAASSGDHQDCATPHNSS